MICHSQWGALWQRSSGVRHFSHHTTPCDNFGIDLLALLLFVSNNRLEQAIKMLVLGIIVFFKGLETSRQVRA